MSRSLLAAVAMAALMGLAQGGYVAASSAVPSGSSAPAQAARSEHEQKGPSVVRLNQLPASALATLPHYATTTRPGGLRVNAAGSDQSGALGFLTLPYSTFHWVTSIFDHCSPDYTQDGKVCRFDGAVGYKSYGVDPSFSLGYAQTPGGSDYLYYDGHNGWDFGLNYENILAAADGTVRLAGADSINPCFGQTIIVEHPNGYSTRYAHLSQIYVVPGQSVTRAQVIAQSGNTGCSSGPHLHFGVYITSSWTAIDPFGWTWRLGADPWPSDPGDLWLTGSAQYPLPSAPTNVVALPGVGSALVTWNAPSWDGGTGITSYTVIASPGGQTVSVPGGTTKALVTGLTNGTTYTFTVVAINYVSSGASSGVSNAVTPNAPSTYYFAEGYTGAGFTETLSLIMPNQSGVALVDFYTGSTHTSMNVPLAAGKVSTVDVNGAVGATEVSAKVSFPGPGVAERLIHFATGTWRGSTDVVGVAQPATEWDFAEGSTLPAFNEYLSLQNPTASPAPVTLHYFTDWGADPTKTLTLPANSRTTVEVFSGDVTSPGGSCTPNGAGASCGIGRGTGGVSTQVLASAPIVAERPMYVNGFNFGNGVIRGGHDAFGANAANTLWNFAEGTTLGGFDEYLTLQNPGTTPAAVTLTYTTPSGSQTIRTLTLAPTSRATVEVFNPRQGVGIGVDGVSVQVVASQPIVAERPIYMVHDFGTGVVASATDVMGATALSKFTGFAEVSTLTGNNDFLTILNPNGVTAHLSITYYTYGNPAVVTRAIQVTAGARHTVQIFAGVEGLGPAYYPVGIVVSSDQPILVEKPTYSSSPGSYGATDTLGATPAFF